MSVNVKDGKSKVSKCTSQSAAIQKKILLDVKQVQTKGRKHIGLVPKEGPKCDAGCLYFNRKYSVSFDPFIKFQSCSLWAHTECAGVSSRRNKFVCEHGNDQCCKPSYLPYG